MNITKKITITLAAVLIIAASFVAGHFHGVAQRTASGTTVSGVSASAQSTEPAPVIIDPAHIAVDPVPAATSTPVTEPAQTLAYTGPFAWITGPLQDICDEREYRRIDDYSAIIHSVMTQEILLDRDKCPYYLAQSCVWGQEDEIIRYYLSRTPSEKLDIQTDDDGNEFIIDRYGDQYEVRRDIFHPELRFFYRPGRYVVQEGDSLLEILDKQGWYSDFRGQDAVDEFVRTHPDVDPDNLVPGQVLRAGLEEVYVLNQDGELIY